MASFEGECEQLLLKIFRLFDSHSTSVIKTHVWSGNQCWAELFELFDYSNS